MNRSGSGVAALRIEKKRQQQGQNAAASVKKARVLGPDKRKKRGNSDGALTTADDDEPDEAAADADLDKENSNASVFLSLVWEPQGGVSSGGRMGVALYSTHNGGDMSVASISAVSSYEAEYVISTVLAQAVEEGDKPSLVIASPSLPDSVRDIIAGRSVKPRKAPKSTDEAGEDNDKMNDETTAVGDDDDDDDEKGSSGIPLRILKSSSFTLQSCRRAVLSTTTGERVREMAAASTSTSAFKPPLRFGGSASIAQQAAAINPISSLVDMSDSALVRAFGGLMLYLALAKVVEVRRSGGNLFGIGKNGVGASDPLAMIASGEGQLFIPGRLLQLPTDSFLQVDALSLSALSVFPRPNSASTQTLSQREASLTLFALLDRSSSSTGRAALKQMLLRPSNDSSVVIDRHDLVAFLVTAQRQCADVWTELRAALRKVKDIPRLFSRFIAFKAKPADWASLENTLLSAIMARDALICLGSSVTVPRDLFNNDKKKASTAAIIAGGGGGDGRTNDGKGSLEFSAQTPKLLIQTLEVLQAPDIEGLQRTLDHVIDWEASKRRGAVAIQDGIDATLDDLRKTQNDLIPYLASTAEEDLAKYAQLQALSYEYLPQVGIVATIDKSAHGILGAAPRHLASSSSSSDRLNTASSTFSTHYEPLEAMADTEAVKKLVPEGWDLVFETSTSLHYTNERTVTLDAYFGRLDENLHDIESGLVRQLEDKIVAEHQRLFYAISKRLGELDALMSFAEVSAAGGYARPKIVKESVLYVKNARNPLQELALQGRALSSASSSSSSSSSFVPNDIALAPGVARAGPIAILTGPNGSGKSVYLRTVGILVLLSQAGCFVPAEKCVMGLVDRLFTRILSQEAASALGLSSFTIDVNAIGSMCRHATPRSLLLIDEFGKGTNCIDGVSLLCATVRYFLRNQSPPKIVITTHFRELFDYELLSGAPPPPPLPTHLLSGASEKTKGDSADTFGVRGLGIAPKNVCFQQMDVRFDKVAVHSIPSSTTTSSSSSSSSSTSSSTPLTQQGSVFDENIEPTPLFRLVPGHAASSFGLQCAIKGGLPVEMVKRAAWVSAQLKAHGAISPLSIETTGDSSDTKMITKKRNFAALSLADLIMAPNSLSEQTTLDRLRRLLQESTQ